MAVASKLRHASIGFSLMRAFSARTIPFVLLFALAYAATGRLGLAMPYIGSNSTLFWPPTGIAVAALFVWGAGMWPGVALGAFLVNLWVGSSAPIAAAIAVGNTLGPLAAVALLRVAGFRREFDRPRDVLAYTGAVVLGMTLPPLGGVAALCAAGAIPWAAFEEAWTTWWLGDSVGALLVGPVLLAFTVDQLRGIRARYAEALVLCAAAFGSAWLIFAFSPRPSVTDPPFVFVSVVPLVWAALRFGPLGASTVALLLSVVAAWATATGRGQFQLADIREGLLLLWAYMATIGAIGLIITALQAQRLRATAELAQSRSILDAIRHAQTRLIVEMDAGRALDDLLHALATTTGSAFAFVAEAPRDRDGRPDRVTCVITDVVRTSGGEGTSASGLQGVPLPALFNDVRGGARSVDAQSEVDRAQLRRWLPLAPPVTSFLALPLEHAGELVGVVGLANRRDGYRDQTPSLLEPFLSTITRVIAFREAEARRRLDAQRLSVALASGEMALFDWNLETGEVFLTEQWRVMLGEPPTKTRTTFNALFCRHDDDAFTLLVARSFARDVWQALATAGAQYGYDALPPRPFRR